MKPKPSKRLVFVSDLHCGSPVAIRAHPETVTQERLLEFWRETIRAFGAGPDVLVVNGDANDGQDRRGLSVRDHDVPWQIEEAEELLLMWRPREAVIVEGTAYHSGDTVQLERFLAGYLDRRGVKCSFATKLRARVNGWFRVQARHRIGRSTIPHGQHTAPGRSQTWQVINAAIEARQAGRGVSWPHLSVFAHAHQWSYAETAMGSYCTLPCWQALGTRYGDTQCDGHVDLGAFQVVVGKTEEEGWTWQRRLYGARVESRTVEL